MKYLYWLFVGTAAILLILLGFWIIWSIWLWVLPQVYPTGPELLLRPDYWLFLAVWFLARFVGAGVFGWRYKND